MQMLLTILLIVCSLIKLVAEKWEAISVTWMHVYLDKGVM